MADFTKLGFDRLTGNISRAINKSNGRLATGDITKGEVVTVAITSGNSASTTVKPRRVGAMPLEIRTDGAGAMGEYIWQIDGTVLTVFKNGGGADATFTFWVF